MGRLDVLVVVAYPDDESIWCGTVLAALSVSSAYIAVVFLTNGDNLVRRAEFHATCEALDVRGCMTVLPYVKKRRLQLANYDLDLLLEGLTPRLVLTQELCGEAHNHVHHIDCHHYVIWWSDCCALPVLCFDSLYPQRGTDNGPLRHLMSGGGDGRKSVSLGNTLAGRIPLRTRWKPPTKPRPSSGLRRLFANPVTSRRPW